MKKATKTKDFSELDETIRVKIGKYVYQPGAGKCLPIHHFILRRNKERPPTKQINATKNLPDDESVAGRYLPGRHDPSFVTDHTTYRFQCWDFAHLGAVGETALHLCVLNSTSIHNDIAKRLIAHFPNIINDIYLCDEYYGENVLHIAIVNEDPAMVKFLLDNGANYHERCLGNFMCPEDQKFSRCDSLEHEWVDLCLSTTYSGYVYWGEYPLSFAACLTQEECYRLILAKGANPDNQDTNGNTVAHMMVIYDKMAMFDMCFELGGSLKVCNRQNLIPMTLACILARRDLFFHIINIEREIYWQIGNVTCAAYPLDFLDTINTTTGETEKKSALNLIAYGEKEAHLDLMEGPIVDLLKTKWDTFVKFRFYRLFYIFFTYFLISLGTYVLRPVPCTRPGNSKQTKQLALMYFASEKISCVNVSIALAKGYQVLKPTTTGNPMSDSGAGPSLQVDMPGGEGLSSILNVTLIPDTDEESRQIPLSSEVFFSSLEEEDDEEGGEDEEDTPETATVVTDRYFIEGEPVTTTMLPAVKAFLSSTAIDNDSCGRSCLPLYFTCHNKSHHLVLSTGSNSTFYISEITKKHIFSKDPVAKQAAKIWQNNTNTNDSSVDPCRCYLWKKPDPLKKGETGIFGLSWSEFAFYVRVVSEGLTLLGSLAYLIGAATEARFQGLQMFFENLSTVPSRVLFLFACVLTIIMAVLRTTCNTEAEDIFAVLAMICTAPYFLFFCRGFKIVGPMVTMIYTMLVGDLLRFVTIYSVFIMGFSQAYYVLFTSYRVISSKSQCSSKNPLSSPIESVMQMFIMSLGNFGDTYEAFECTQHEITSKVMFLIFMAIVSLLLINLLIAMMGNTYQIIAEMKNEWMRQWARIVLVVERGLNPEVRLQKLMEYSQPMSDGRRALVLRLHQNDEEREEMKEIMDMKRVHRRYVERRKKKIEQILAEARKINSSRMM